MPTEILMPALSPTMEEGKLVKWHVGEGDAVRAGDVIAEIETDKATMEVEAVDEGRIGKLLVPEGTEHVKVNQPIALLYIDGEDTSRAHPPASGPWKLETRARRPLLRMRVYLLTLRRARQRPSRRVRPRRVKAKQPDEPPPDFGEVPPLVEKAPAGPRVAPPEPKPEPEMPPGTEMVTMTVREALRDAMAEEMRRDPSVFLMGEEVAPISGRLQSEPGPAR